LGPEQWIITASQLKNKNAMFAEAFRAVAKGQALFETDREAWHHAAIVGHMNASKLFPFTREEGRVLQEWDVVVVSQLFGINELTGRLDKTENLMLAQRLLRFPLL
jgi:hypothetical protein